MSLQSPDSDDLRTLVESCDEFTQCEDCGTYVVSIGPHQCSSSSDGASDRAARQARAVRDTRDDDDEVVIFRRSVGHTYAYHELDGDDVYCGCGKYTKASRADVVTRSRAKTLGRSPCGNCERLRSLRGDE